MVFVLSLSRLCDSSLKGQLAVLLISHVIVVYRCSNTLMQESAGTVKPVVCSAIDIEHFFA